MSMAGKEKPKAATNAVTIRVMTLLRSPGILKTPIRMMRVRMGSDARKISITLV